MAYRGNLHILTQTPDQGGAQSSIAAALPQKDPDL